MACLCIRGSRHLSCALGVAVAVAWSAAAGRADAEELTSASFRLRGIHWSAAAGNLGLLGTFQAWLADSTTSPAVRFTPNSFGYRTVAGTTIADDWADLTDGTLDAPVGGGGIPWTNVAADGTAVGGNHCSDWTSASAGVGVVGNSTSTNGSWTNDATHPCSAIAGLYCLQQ
ncbi:MAG: hypothetical protein ACE5FL_11770 [Myxococcota bacterium]